MQSFEKFCFLCAGVLASVEMTYQENKTGLVYKSEPLSWDHLRPVVADEWGSRDHCSAKSSSNY